ncbi:MAG: helix-turn-helix domain containing protein [Alphaproteobacteria bacterium]|nr:helix-turn-helix domain containing protein [Alphaproteobacteria bacterium]
MAAKKKTKKADATPAVDVATDIIGAAMKLAGVQGWRDTTMADIADAAGITLVELRQLYGSKTAILAGLIRQTDDIVLAGSGADMVEEPVRDRLFDVIMRRLDALAPYRSGIAAVARDLPRDPTALACLAAGPGRRSLQWMLEAARIQPWGLAAPLQIKGLGLVYASVLRVWLSDEGEDLSKTMAALNKALGRVESVLATLRRGPRGFRRNNHKETEAPERDAE